MWSLEESIAQYNKILHRPLPFTVRVQKFVESTRLTEHGVLGQKWHHHKQEDDTPKKSKYGSKTIDPSKAGGYWKHGSLKGKTYNFLESLNGDWIKFSELKSKMSSEDQDQKHSLNGIRKAGKQTGRWSLEISGAGKGGLFKLGDEASIRLFVANRASVQTPESEKRTEETEAKATKLAKDYMSMGPNDPKGSKELFSNYYKEMGVSQDSRDSMEYAVRAWTGTVNSDKPQAMRMVAMEYYGRKPSGEYTDGHSNKIKDEYDETKGDADKMKPAVMAMKAYAGAYAKEQGISVLYRGVAGKAAKDIIDAIKNDGEVKLAVNSLSSWSQSKSVASGFGDVVLKLKVDPSNIWAVHSATPWLFSSHSSEKEYIVGHHQPFEKFKKGDVEMT
jgi:hypothetical protein